MLIKEKTIQHKHTQYETSREENFQADDMMNNNNLYLMEMNISTD